MRRLYDEWAIVATIDPASYAAGTEQLSDEIDLSKFHELAAVLTAGDIQATGTIDGGFQGSTTSGGSYAAISGKAITQLTAAGSDDNKQVVVHLRADDQTRRYVKFGVTPATADSIFGVTVLGKPRYNPPTEQDLASVDEVL